MKKIMGKWVHDIGEGYGVNASAEMVWHAEEEMYKWRMWAWERKRDRGIDCEKPVAPKSILWKKTKDVDVDCECVVCGVQLRKGSRLVRRSNAHTGVHCDECRERKRIKRTVEVIGNGKNT